MSLEYNNPVILHLSDLHFGKHHQTKVPSNEIRTIPDEPITEELLNDLERLEAEWKPNFIIISGDLLEQPPFDPDNEQGKASKFMRKLRKSITPTIPKKRVIIVPGNHDIAWHERIKKKGKSRKRLITEYDKKFDCFRGMDLSRSFKDPKDIFCKFYDEFNITIFGFNSNVCTYKHYNAGYITDEQMKSIDKTFERELKKAKDKNGCKLSIKVAVVHHHILPLPEVNFDKYDIMPDAGTFLWELINNNVDIVLHGHKHFPYIYKASIIDSSMRDKEIFIIGAGSVGSKKTRRLNQYKLIKIFNSQDGPNEHNIRFEVRPREFSGPKFGDSKFYGQGSLVLRYKPSLEEMERLKIKILKQKKEIEKLKKRGLKY